MSKCESSRQWPLVILAVSMTVCFAGAELAIGDEKSAVQAGSKVTVEKEKEKEKKAIRPAKQRQKPLLFDPIVAGVKQISRPGALPGPLEISADWTPIAFGDGDSYVDVGGKHETPAVVVAARTFGKGRIVAAGHGYLSLPERAGPYDNERLGRNVVLWLDSRNTRAICLRQTKWSGGIETELIDDLLRTGYVGRRVPRNVPLSLPVLAGCGVLVYDTQWDQVPRFEIDTIEQFVRSGGGLYICGLAWSYITYVEKNLDRFPMNQVGARFGIRFADGIVSDPTNNIGGPGEPIIRSFYPAKPNSGPFISPGESPHR